MRADVMVTTFNEVPRVNHTLKYELLGPLAIDSHRAYCERHGYDFSARAPVAADRPACWAKIPALLAALEDHEWALWVDSDTLVADREQRLERFCDDRYDLVVQSHAEFYRLIGVPLAAGLERMPINTGAFLVRSSAWSRDFLRRAYEQTQFVSRGEVWDGIGEQEAMIALLRSAPADRRRIGYVTGLQNHPRLYRGGDLLLHFYGNHARHRIAGATCAEVTSRWAAAVGESRPLPPDRARFHWCCIQNKHADAPIVRGDVDRYLYELKDIA
jgi:galactosyl transferase GMA12/MNN10 family